MDVIQKKLHFSSPQMIIFGFILVNLMGCLLLMLFWEPAELSNR